VTWEWAMTKFEIGGTIKYQQSAERRRHPAHKRKCQNLLTYSRPPSVGIIRYEGCGHCPAFAMWYEATFRSDRGTSVGAPLGAPHKQCNCQQDCQVAAVQAAVRVKYRNKKALLLKTLDLPFFLHLSHNLPFNVSAPIFSPDHPRPK
jgi:hypothetical protein